VPGLTGPVGWGRVGNFEMADLRRSGPARRLPADPVTIQRDVRFNRAHHRRDKFRPPDLKASAETGVRHGKAEKS
jgi:hypothetical protein